MSETIRLIVDTDIGVDDAQALMLALTHPGTRVKAITAVVGTTMANASRNSSSGTTITTAVTATMITATTTTGTTTAVTATTSSTRNVSSE